jgi:ABC-2 type transport system permease protein
MTLTRLLVRRHRLALGSWLVLLVALCGGTVSAYASTYATAQQRRAAVELAQHNPATTLLYGRLPDPGTPAQMYVWEVGAFATVLAAIMAVVVSVALTRAVEDDGTVDLVRSCGVAPRQPLRSALTVLAGVAGVLTVGCGTALGSAAGRVEGVTWAGAFLFGAVLGTTFLVVSALTILLAQIAPNAGQARLLGLVSVGFAVTLRALADSRWHAPLNRFTPLGLRAEVAPFTDDRWVGLVPGLLVAALSAWAALALAARREVGAGLLPRRDHRDRRLRLRTAGGLAERLGRSSLVAWTIGVSAVGALFSAMGSGTVRQQRDGELGGFLGAQLGGGDPVAGYLAYCYTVVGIIVAVYAVVSTLGATRDEAAGLTDLVVSTGVRRWAPLAWRGALTAFGCAVILAVTGAVGAAIAPAVLDGNDLATRSMAYALGQWPAALAVTGGAVLLIGLRPRWAPLAWFPVIASAALALLGNLLRIPQRVQDLGFLRHVPDVAAADPRTGGLVILTAVGATACVMGVAAVARRDLGTG